MKIFWSESLGRPVVFPTLDALFRCLDPVGETGERYEVHVKAMKAGEQCQPDSKVGGIGLVEAMTVMAQAFVRRFALGALCRAAVRHQAASAPEQPFDPSWNQAVEDQASDWAHRSGRRRSTD
jgi:hypothetical protein